MRYINLKAACFVVVSLLVVAPLIWPQNASGAQLLSRSVAVGNSAPSATTVHLISYTYSTVATLGSLEFEYCVNSPQVGSPCVAPTGLDVSGVIIAGQSGETGFTVDPGTTVNRILLTRPASVNAVVPATYTFSNILNPSTTNTTVFIRISSFASTDGTGVRTDDGTVAFSTADNLSVSGYVPPYLIFCVGVTVAGDCSSANGQLLSFGELKANQPSFVTSQFAGATNDPGGYSTFVNGVTMTSGTNVIPALVVPQASQVGVSQFGMNLRANTSPGVGNNPSGIGTSVPVADFNQPNLYVFKNQILTSSPISTDFNLFTASYVVNVASNQPAGVYNTTLTYIATAAF